MKVSAPGKLILSGEHAVVYGYPALTTAVNLRLTMSSSGETHSDIPMKSGMGSSAAFAVAQSALKLGKLDLNQINNSAYEIEKKFHGNPSGADPTVVTYGGYLWYRKESPSLRIFKSITPQIPFPALSLIQSGTPVESTKEMVTQVSRLYSRKKIFVENVFQKIESVTREFLKYLLCESQTDIKELIQENEQLLEQLGVVSEKTKHLIRLFEKEGGSAKISGAGGASDGSGMLILFHKDPEKIDFIAQKYHLKTLPIRLGEKGVRFEQS